MSKIIDGYLSNLGVSRPIFRLSKDSYGQGRLELTTLHPYVTPPTEDLVERLVYAHHQEVFNAETGQFELPLGHIKDAAMGDVILDLLRIIERNLETKKPRQSKLYKFFNYVNKNNEELCDALVHVWKYSRTYSDGQGFFESKNLEHMKNTLGILELLRKKYER